jgi:hypothetical protein
MTVSDRTLLDLDVSQITHAFPTVTKAGSEELLRRIQTPIQDPSILQTRQTQLQDIQRRCRDPSTLQRVHQLRTTLSDTEEAVRSVASAGDDARMKEYYNQILWPADSWFAPLNHRSWIVELLVLLRTILLPGLAVIMPLFVLVAPFILYTFVLKKPIGVQEYIDVIQQSLKKVVPSVLGAPRFTGKGGVLEAGEKFVHVGLSLGMFVFSIWNQVSAALHMRKIVGDIRGRSVAVKQFRDATQELSSLLGVTVTLGSEWSEGSFGPFGDAWNSPDRVHTILRAAGEVDMLIAVALRKRVCFPTYSEPLLPTLEIQDLYHPGVAKEKRVYNSLIMKDRRHILLTGPNRGGKSTLLKSIGMATIMAQTLGVVFARKATLPIFQSVVSALSPSDDLGKMSLFEAEIEFAKQVKQTVAESTGPVFLMMDEIFHGTNAHDGVEAAQVFLDDLYAMEKPVFSIVSTHYMDLPKRYGDSHTQNLCMDASQDPVDPDCLKYTYRLIPGVNTFSSVREILRERGLLSKKTPALASKK